MTTLLTKRSVPAPKGNLKLMRCQGQARYNRGEKRKWRGKGNVGRRRRGRERGGEEGKCVFPPLSAGGTIATGSESNDLGAKAGGGDQSLNESHCP